MSPQCHFCARGDITPMHADAHKHACCIRLQMPAGAPALPLAQLQMCTGSWRLPTSAAAPERSWRRSGRQRAAQIALHSTLQHGHEVATEGLTVMGMIHLQPVSDSATHIQMPYADHSQYSLPVLPDEFWIRPQHGCCNWQAWKTRPCAAWSPLAAEHPSYPWLDGMLTHRVGTAAAGSP